MPLLPFLSPSFQCWADVIWYRVSLWSVWVSCPGYFLFCFPSLLVRREYWNNSSDAVPILRRGSQSNAVQSISFYLPIQSTILWGAAMGKIKLISERPNTDLELDFVWFNIILINQKKLGGMTKTFCND